MIVVPADVVYLRWINNRLVEKVHIGRHHQLNQVLYVVGEILNGKVI